MSELPLSDIMDVAATGGERALADAAGAPLMALPVEAVTSVWDALTCDEALLGLVAYEMGVNLLEESWTLDQKRHWINDNWTFLSLRGTLAGVRMALGASGYKLVEYMKPPQGFFASPNLTKKEYDAWIKLMPELRITFARREGLDNGQWFADDGFCEDAFVGLNDGPALYGAFAFIRQNGVDTPLDTITEVKSIEKQTVRDIERFSFPGKATMGFFADESGADDNQFPDAEEVAAYVTTVILDKRYNHEVSELELTTVTPGLKPIDARYEINSDIGFWGFQTFNFDCFADEDFAGENDAAELLARRVFLLDPDVQVPKTRGVSFADYDRVGFEPKTIELMVELGEKDNGSGSFCDEMFAEEAFAVSEDTTARDRAIRAIEAARGHTDQTLVRFDTFRPITPDDTPSDATHAGEWVRNSL